MNESHFSDQLKGFLDRAATSVGAQWSEDRTMLEWPPKEEGGKPYRLGVSDASYESKVHGGTSDFGTMRLSEDGPVGHMIYEEDPHNRGGWSASIFSGNSWSNGEIFTTSRPSESADDTPSAETVREHIAKGVEDQRKANEEHGAGTGMETRPTIGFGVVRHYRFGHSINTQDYQYNRKTGRYDPI